MLFNSSEVLKAVKQLASANRLSRRSHCQLLNLYAERLGYQDYHHLRQSLRDNNSDPDAVGNVCLKMMRLICAERLPSVEENYCQFTIFQNRRIAYNSYWIGWDKAGNELRVPRRLDGMRTVEHYRWLLPFPVYVIESKKEFVSWWLKWLGMAVMPTALAQDAFPLVFERGSLVEGVSQRDTVCERSAYHVERLNLQFMSYLDV